MDEKLDEHDLAASALRPLFDKVLQESPPASMLELAMKLRIALEERELPRGDLKDPE